MKQNNSGMFRISEKLIGPPLQEGFAAIPAGAFGALSSSLLLLPSSTTVLYYVSMFDIEFFTGEIIRNPFLM